MTGFESYKNSFPHAKLQRSEAGVLEVTLPFERRKFGVRRRHARRVRRLVSSDRSRRGHPRRNSDGRRRRFHRQHRRLKIRFWDSQGIPQCFSKAEGFLQT